MKDPFRPRNIAAWISFFAMVGIATYNFWIFRDCVSFDLVRVNTCLLVAVIAYVAVRLTREALSDEWLRSPYPFGHCRTCGYNLTGNVSGVCPECGKTV